MTCPDGNGEHRWIHLGESDGFSAYECHRCGAELHDHEKEESMNITPDQARDLRSNVERTGYDFPFQFQPWGEQNQNGDREESILMDATGEILAYGLPDSVGELLVFAPNLAQTIAGMEWQWGVEITYRSGTETAVLWFSSEDDARQEIDNPHRQNSNPRLVRRLVGPVEEVE